MPCRMLDRIGAGVRLEKKEKENVYNLFEIKNISEIFSKMGTRLNMIEEGWRLKKIRKY